ncbi:hypothetical protein PAXINDRAFT_18224 [Paxillus involutus ATCC 200175]|uniref:Uncharacterized protein n=1 Tax=Paxillus involutus ATCC 200175 TaxID=664439 RepID=A0A0C9SZH0_PAXIN|nr:hypothetical protein PAXINDRAFT_18224 [Paxillus involutus ATCC 200175]
MTRQTAIDDKAADTTDPHANSAGPAVPVGTMNELSNGVDEGVDEGDRKVNSNDNGGDEDVRHVYVVPKLAPPSPYHLPPPADESRPPPSMLLKGEMTGKQSSGHANEAATHLEVPPDQSRTRSPIRTPHDKSSSGEGQEVTIGHRQTVGEKDEVGVRYNNQETSDRDDEQQSRRGEARDEAKEDEEEPPPPPPAPPAPPYPERRLHNIDKLKLNETPARACADAVHDPGGETDTPGSVPPSIRLEGERNRATSLNVEPNNNEVDETKPSRNPVGTMDGNERHPSEPQSPLTRRKGIEG